MYHELDCCETVSIEDIDGDLMDLIGETILEAEETSRRKPAEDDDDNCYEFKKDAFGYLYYIHLEKGIHPDCPIKGQTITFKIGETNE
jgi:hypothetical protein